MKNKMIAAAIGLPLLAGTSFLVVSNALAAGPAKPASSQAADCCPAPAPTTETTDCCPAYDSQAKVAAAADGCCDGAACCH